MTAQRVSEQTGYGVHGLHGSSRYYDAVGRPRKLAAGAMEAIKREFAFGIPTRELAERYGVSPSLILQICYWTPKGNGKRPAPQRMRPVVIPLSLGAIDEIEIGEEK